MPFLSKPILQFHLCPRRWTSGEFVASRTHLLESFHLDSKDGVAVTYQRNLSFGSPKPQSYYSLGTKVDMPTYDPKRKEECQTKIYEREISLLFGKKQPINFLNYWGQNFMDWICQRREGLPELFQRDKLLLHSHVMLFQLFITWDDFLWLPRSQGRVEADPKDFILQISSASVKGYVMSQNG